MPRKRCVWCEDFVELWELPIGGLPSLELLALVVPRGDSEFSTWELPNSGVAVLISIVAMQTLE